MRVFAITLVALVACTKASSNEAQERSASSTAADGHEGAAQLESDSPQPPESPARPSDSELERRIAAILLGDPRTADAVRTVDVNVAAGVAVLTGSAPSQEQADVAELLARRVPGVTRVDNYIAIRSPTSNVLIAPKGNRRTPPPPTDAEILATTRRALGSGTKIELSVDSGVVTLGGVAGTEEVRHAAAIARAAGARQVLDQTRLVPLEITP